MIFYFSYFCVFIMQALSSYFKDKVVDFVFLIIIIFYFVLLAGLRDNTGWDFDNYALIFTERSSFEYLLTFGMEPGFILLNILISSIDNDYAYMFLVFSILSVSIKVSSFYKWSPYFILSFLYYYSLFFLTKDMGQIRQALAVSILMLSYPFLINKRFAPFFLIVITACSIHISSILFLFSYFFVNIDIKRKTYILLLLVSVIIAFLNVNLLLSSILEQLDSIPLARRALYYFANEKETGRIGLTLGVLWKVFIFSAVMYKWNSLNEKVAHFRAFFNVYFVGFFVFLCLNSNRIFAGRLTESYFIIECLIVPFLIYSFRRISEKLIFIFFVFSYLFLKLSQFVSDEHYSDYMSILS